MALKQCIHGQFSISEVARILEAFDHGEMKHFLIACA